jgi:dihydropyrimidinase
MAFDLVIKNADIQTASDRYTADIGVTGEIIVEIGQNLDTAGAKVIDATGLRVVPGGIDVHTHLDMPFMGAVTADDFKTGTEGAAAGGTTTIVDFAIQAPGESLQSGVDNWHKRADGKAVVDYGFHLIVTDLPEERVPEMDAIIEQGIPSFKLFMAYKGALMSEDDAIYRALRRADAKGGMVSLHCENGHTVELMVKEMLAEGKTAPEFHALSRPTACEGEATHRGIKIAEMAGAPLYIVHMTCKEALDAVRRAKKAGKPILGETCPQYLYLSHDDYKRPGFEGAKFVMSPPLRPKENQEPLWQGLRDGTLSTVATDHCSFCFEMKPGAKLGKVLGKDDFSKIPNGAPGIEYRMQLMWDAVAKGKITAEKFVELTATNPAKIFGMYGKKGTIAVGFDADITMIDPNKEFTLSVDNHHMNVDYNPYEGMTVAGTIQEVILRGKRLVEGGKLNSDLAPGQFIKRAKYGETLDSKKLEPALV